MAFAMTNKRKFHTMEYRVCYISNCLDLHELTRDDVGPLQQKKAQRLSNSQCDDIGT
jgi:hypothetical protein